MVDWLDLGFDVLIGLAIIGAIVYSGWQVWKKRKKEREENDLPRL